MEKKLKSPEKGELKGVAKKRTSKSLNQVKAIDKKDVKKTLSKAKVPIINATKNPVQIKSKIRAEKKAKSAAKQRLVPHIITHAKNHYFTPELKKDLIETNHNKNKEERAFRGKEEVVLHQENQNVKAGMVSLTDRKRIFNSQGRR